MVAKRKLPRHYYLKEDVVSLSQSLLGKFIVTRIGGQETAGMIVETEAYHGPEDKASHAYNNRRTNRTEVMYAPGGVAYVYLCYGIHHLFNIVTGPEDTPHAVLVRAIEPTEGLPEMLKRRKMRQCHYKLSAGPGTLTQALGITTQLSGCPLLGAPIWIEDRGVEFTKKEIVASPRVGIDYAQEYKDLPWRFRVRNNPWTSRAP